MRMYRQLSASFDVVCPLAFEISSLLSSPIKVSTNHFSPAVLTVSSACHLDYVCLLSVLDSKSVLYHPLERAVLFCWLLSDEVLCGMMVVLD